MTTQTRPTPDIFPISVHVRAGAFRDLGGLDGVTLPLAEDLHFANVQGGGPSRYLVRGWPLRPGLRLPSGEPYQGGYLAGVMVGTAVVRAALRAAGLSQNTLQMPPDPEADGRIRDLCMGALKGRFRLQGFFTDEDALAALHWMVQIPWRTHHVDLESLPTADAVSQQANDVDVGAGDAFALCAALCGLRSDDIVPLSPEQHIRLMGKPQ